MILSLCCPLLTWTLKYATFNVHVRNWTGQLYQNYTWSNLTLGSSVKITYLMFYYYNKMEGGGHEVIAWHNYFTVILIILKQFFKSVLEKYLQLLSLGLKWDNFTSLVIIFYRDASFGTCSFHLTLLDCFHAINKVSKTIFFVLQKVN